MALACGDEGLRFCSQVPDDPEWGPCIEDLECTVGETRECEEDGTERCLLFGGVPGWDTSNCRPFEGDDTPLVLAFAPGPVRLTDAGAQAFDLATQSGCSTSDWPSATTPWLAIDLDESGAIEDGRELFGNGTVLPDGRRAAHGFLALAQLDHDGDGRITPADPRYGELVAWSDHDQDRIGTLAELTPLAILGVHAIDLDHRVDPRCDARGNCEVERAAFSWGDGAVGEVVDVHLSCH